MSFNYDQITKGYYHEIYNKNNARSNWHKIKFQRVINEIKFDNNTHSGVLDYGCGPGTFLSLFNSNFKLGYDISEDQIDFAKQLVLDGQFTTKYSDLESYYRDISHITACELIEHLEYKQIIKFFDLIKKIVIKRSEKNLKTTVIITTPNYISFWPILEIFVDIFSRQNYRAQHVSKFKVASIKKIIKENFLLSEFNYDLKINSFQGFSWINKKLSFTDKIFEKINFGNLIFCKINFNSFKNKF